MKFLVVGGTGYLGSKFVEKSNEQGNEIYCWRRSANKRIHFNKKVTYYDGGLEHLANFLNEKKIDVILYAACVYDGVDNNIESLEANLELPIKVMSIACKSYTHKFIHIGTSLPSNVNFYSLTKNQVSEFGQYYVENNHGFSYSEILLESFYGPDQPKNRFLTQCVLKMLKNEDIELTQGLQHRDYVHINDVINALLIISHHMEPGYSEYSLGSGTAPSIREILEYMKHETKSKSNLLFGAKASRVNEPDCCANLMALNRLGFHPLYNWKTGITELTNFVKIYQD